MAVTMKRLNSFSFLAFVAVLLLNLVPVSIQAQCLNSDTFVGTSLASFWTALDINPPAGSPGGAQVEGSSLTITSIDNNIVPGGTTDSFRYIYQSVASDADIT